MSFTNCCQKGLVGGICSQKPIGCEWLSNGGHCVQCCCHTDRIKLMKRVLDVIHDCLQAKKPESKHPSYVNPDQPSQALAQEHVTDNVICESEIILRFSADRPRVRSCIHGNWHKTYESTIDLSFTTRKAWVLSIRPYWHTIPPALLGRFCMGMNFYNSVLVLEQFSTMADYACKCRCHCWSETLEPYIYGLAGCDQFVDHHTGPDRALCSCKGSWPLPYSYQGVVSDQEFLMLYKLVLMSMWGPDPTLKLLWLLALFRLLLSGHPCQILVVNVPLKQCSTLNIEGGYMTNW